MNKTLKIVLTGPESTGKSTLTELLAKKFSVPFIPELAREYLNNKHQKYTYDDIVEIAKLQIATERELLKKNCNFIFLDTDLIITKIWFLHCYGKCPNFVDDYLKNESKPAFHLLCYYDLPWEPDPLRENPHIRNILFEKYKKEIENYSFDYSIIKGYGDDRINLAISLVEDYIMKFKKR